MRLLIIRHAIAENRAEFARSGKPDEERPLTSEGRQRMEQAAQGLVRVIANIDLLASSPLERAMQTAEIIGEAHGKLPVEVASILSGAGDLDGIVRWLSEKRDAETIALVGHEPDLSGLISYLLTGTCSAAVAMKKGAACLLEFDGGAEPGKAILRWFLAPKQLRAIGGSHA